MIVYKYVSPRWIEVLKDCLIRFTQPAALNDPFESNPIDGKLFDSLVEEQIKYRAGIPIKLSRIEEMEVTFAIRRNARNAVKDLMDESRLKKGILSVSLVRNDLLMWSHYADSHRGFVIGFDGLHKYFQDGIPDKRGGLRPVKYSEKRPILPPHNEFSTHNVAEILLFTKSPHWSYEKEMRMLHNVEHADVTKKPDNGDPIYLFKFPAETVKEVILGCQMPKPLRTEFVDLVKEKYPDAKL